MKRARSLSVPAEKCSGVGWHGSADVKEGRSSYGGQQTESGSGSCCGGDEAGLVWSRPAMSSLLYRNMEIYSRSRLLKSLLAIDLHLPREGKSGEITKSVP